MMRNTTNILFVATVLALPSSVAFANGQHNLQRLLRGNYHVVGQETCVDTAAGFSGPPVWVPCSSPDNPVNCAPVVQYESTSTGHVSFDGEGNAHGTWKTLTVIDDPNQPEPPAPPPGIPPLPPVSNFYISAATTECNYTYTVNPDRTFTMDLSSCTGTLTAGGGTGLSLIITGGSAAEGFIGQGRQTLMTATVEPLPQMIAVNNSPSPSYRICTTMNTYLRAWPDSNGARHDGQQSEEEDNLNPIPWW